MTVTVDASAAVLEYQRAFRKLAELSGFSQRDTLRAEAGVIIKTWAGQTKVATKDSAELFARYRAGKRAFGINRAGRNMFGITVNTGRGRGAPGMVWFRTARNRWQTPANIYSGGYISQNHLHFKDDDWARIEAGMVTYAAELTKILPAAERARGLARQSVVIIADALGIDLGSVKGGGGLSAAGIAKARAAIASNGTRYVNGGGKDDGNEIKYYVEFFNNYPMNVKIGMDSALGRILANRARFIEMAYQKGAFDSIKKTAASFPNLYAKGLETPAAA